MNKGFKYIYLLIFLINSSAIAQIDDMSLLGMLGEGVGTTGIERDVEEIEPRDTDDKARDDLEKKDFKDGDYGYTGGKNFNNPPIVKFPDEPLEYFGYSYFSSSANPYLPLINVPVPPDYLIGPDDIIKIILFGNKNKKYELIVNRDGDIFIPELGPLTVAGLTFQNLKELVKQSISSNFIGTEASTTLGRLRTIDIFVLGAAVNPGMYSLSALSKMTNAIFDSGGVDPSGSLRNIKLKRNGKIMSDLDLYDLLIDGDTSNDKRLMQGDVILIEPIGRTAGIRGEVNRPAIYELKGDENLSDLMRFAGNMKPKASKSNSEVLRINQSRGSFDLLRLDLGIESEARSEIKNGDIVSIFPINNKIQNAVLVLGHSIQPGFYPWSEGMRIKDLFGSSDDLLEMTDLNYILIKRKDEIAQNYSFLQTDLEQVLIDENSKHNIILNNQDEILLLPSLLTPDSITTKLIQDKYELDRESQMFLLEEDEWTSLTYLRKSLMDEEIEIEDQKRILGNQGIKSETETDFRRYYEYSIYDYCIIPEDLAIFVVEESGFRAKKSVPLEDLEDFRTPQDFLRLQQSLEEERIRSRNLTEAGEQDLSMTITSVCRDQLLRPFLDLIKRDDFVEKMNMISIFGSVHFPGIYPYSDGMSLADAIKAAGGPKNGTYESEVEITSLTNQDKKYSSTNKFSSIDDADQLKLNKMDTVNLKQISTEIKTVEIKGEVFFPGVYPIPENQTLTELIRRAGGFTNYASPRAAFFQREALKIAEEERFKSAQSELKRKILLSSQAGGLGQASLDGNSITQLTSLIAQDVDEGSVMGRLVIDLERILSGQSSDIVLEEGDTINIPKSKQSISVIGEVFIANSHIFQDKLGIDDYISLSGGSTQFADEASTYIIKADGSILSPSQISSGFFRSTSELQPGDTIVVPLQVQPFSGIKATTEVTQIIYQMALAAAAVNSF